MSSVLPTPETDYLAPPAPRRLVVNRAVWNAVMGSIGARLREIEGKRAELQSIIDDLRYFGLLRLDEAIIPLINDTQAQLAALAQAVENTIAQNAQIIEDFQGETTAALTTLNQTIEAAIVSLNGQIDAISQRVDEILDGGIPAADVAEDGNRVFVSPQQRDQIGLLRDDLEALIVSVGEALDAIGLAKQSKSEKNQPDGYLGLDADGQIPAELRFSEYPLGSAVRFKSDPGPNWLEADGSVYLNSAYPDLARKLGPMPLPIALTAQQIMIPSVGQLTGMILCKGNVIGLAAGRVFTAPQSASPWTASSYTERTTPAASGVLQRLVRCEDDDRLFLWVAQDGEANRSHNMRYSDDGGMTWVNLGNAILTNSQSVSDVIRSCRKLDAATYVMVSTGGTSYRIKTAPLAITQHSLATSDTTVRDGVVVGVSGTTIVRLSPDGTRLTASFQNRLGNINSPAFFFDEEHPDDAFMLGFSVSAPAGAGTARLSVWRIADFMTAAPSAIFETSSSVDAPAGDYTSFYSYRSLKMRNAEGEATGHLFFLFGYVPSSPILLVIGKRFGEDPVLLGVFQSIQSSDPAPSMGPAGIVVSASGSTSYRLIFPTGYDPATMFNMPAHAGHYVRTV